MSWVRWLIVALSIVLVLALVAYARGERQRGEDTAESTAVTAVVL